MNMKTIILLASMTTLCATSFADVVYKNDFSSRTSKSPVPYGEWREAPYQTGAFVNDSYNDPFSGTAFQDNWIRGRNNCSCPVHIVSDNGNPEVVMHNAAGENKHVIVKHRLGNTFTDGRVTAQCDLRAPATWTGYSFVQEFFLGDENFFSPETETADNGSLYLNYRAAQAGVGRKSATGTRQFTYLDGNADRQFTGQGSATTWYRVVLTLDLDTRKYSVSFYDMGDAHPALDAATPTVAAFEKTGIAMSFDAVTSVSSLGLSCYCPHGGADAASLDLSLAGQFDNIRVAHNGVECYVNDLTTRRSRALGGTTAGSYAATSPVSNTVGTETYVGGEALYAASTGDKTVSQPVGTDGWRRLNSDLKATPAVYSDEGNLTMRFSPSATGIAAATIGQTLTTGKVRVSADVRATGIGGENTNQGVYLYAGSDALYDANHSQFGSQAGLFARIGIVGTKTTVDSSTYRRPYWRDASGAHTGTDDEWVKQGTWLRFTIEADLDAGTYSCTIRDQGATHPGGDAEDGETVYFTKSGIGRINATVSGISCVAFSVYSSEAMFDNIKVWHTPTGAAEETLVYDNRFNSRTINYENFLEGALVGDSISKSPAGQDGWTRVNNGSLKAVVREDAGNPALTFAQGGDNVLYAVHDIGEMCKYGRLKTRLDACPPAGWQGGTRGSLFWLAGDAFHEGNLKSGSEFYKAAAFAFGFHGTSNNEVKLCVFNGSYTYDALALDPSHWYRFVAVTRLDEGASDIAVYDLGTEHPTFDTPTPAASVATFSSIPFRCAPAALGGVSTIGFSAMGTMDNTLDGRSGVFWDNVQIDWNNKGLLIILR